MKYVAGIAAATTIAIAFASCGRKLPLGAECIIRPSLQWRVSAADTACLTIKGFTLVGDTAQWGVSSWDDAVAGRFTDRSSGIRRSAETGVFHGEDSLIRFRLEHPRTVVLLCDTTDSIYALRNVDIVGGLPSLSLKVRFSVTETRPSYRDNGWLMVNPFL
jgi:hypothetical protein